VNKRDGDINLSIHTLDATVRARVQAGIRVVEARAALQEAVEASDRAMRDYIAARAGVIGLLSDSPAVTGRTD